MSSIEFDGAYAAQLRQRRAQIAELVERACEASGRKPEDVVVCAVSKTVDVPQVAAARAAGYTEFAENRPQELERKLSLIAGDPAFEGVRWHMIGNLQENKINHVLAARPCLVHSISSAKLAEAVSKRAVVAGIVQPVLLEANVSGEESKQGMAPDELKAMFEMAQELEGIDVRGLMTMAPQGDMCVAEHTFEGLRLLRDELAQAYPQASLQVLSMGMSEDFEAGIRQGATIVRLGRVAFDPTFSIEERLHI